MNTGDWADVLYVNCIDVYATVPEMDPVWHDIRKSENLNFGVTQTMRLGVLDFDDMSTVRRSNGPGSFLRAVEILICPR